MNRLFGFVLQLVALLVVYWHFLPSVPGPGELYVLTGTVVEAKQGRRSNGSLLPYIDLSIRDGTNTSFARVNDISLLEGLQPGTAMRAGVHKPGGLGPSFVWWFETDKGLSRSYREMAAHQSSGFRFARVFFFVLVAVWLVATFRQFPGCSR